MDNPEVSKILYIDDDLADQKLFKRALSQSRFNVPVSMASTGGEGLSAVREGDYDLIFLDYLLPDMDGIDVLGKIRPEFPNLPIVVVTSHGDENLAIQAMRAGASDYLPKSYLDAPGLNKCIRNVLDLYAAELSRQEAEKKLAQSKADIAALIESSSSWIWSIDKELRIIHFNSVCFSQFKRHFGIEIEAGMRLDQILPFMVAEIWIPLIKEGLAGKNISQENHYSFNGIEFELELTINPIRVENQTASGVAIFASDITDRKKAEKELKQAKQLAEESVIIKNNFLANMSHEIRTPMNAILGFADLLSTTKLGHEQQEFLEAVRESGKNLLTIINDILDFSKIEAGKVELEEQYFNVEDVLNNVSKMLTPKAREKSINLFMVSPEDPIWVEGDSVRLNQILVNLIGNAIKFTPEGSVGVGCKIENEKEDQVVVGFSVEDTGIGIPEDKLSLVFERFSQASNSTTREYGGTGLGLAIARDLVTMQGGEMEVQSEVGKGSLFTFSIPYRKISEAEMIQLQSRVSLPKKETRKIKILIVEDNLLNQKLAMKILEDQDVSLAENGREAVEKIEKDQFDIVLMDIMMPDMDGYEATKYIREKLKSDVPIIAVTAHSMLGEKEKCLAIGMNDYISKPYKKEELIEKINGQLD